MEVHISIPQSEAVELFNLLKAQPVEIQRKFVDTRLALLAGMTGSFMGEPDFGIGQRVQVATDLSWGNTIPAFNKGMQGKVVGVLQGRVAVAFPLPYLDPNQTYWERRDGVDEFTILFDPSELEAVITHDQA